LRLVKTAPWLPLRYETSESASEDEIGPMPLPAIDVSTLIGVGQDAAHLTFLQIALRGVVVFVATVAMIRCGDRRFLSQKTAFDAVLGFILASMLARAVNGNSAFFPTLGGGFVLVLLHRLLASWSRRSHLVGYLVKGRHDVLIRDGQLDEAVAAGNQLSRRDVLEDLRLHGNVRDVDEVALAVYERNGQIRVVPK